MLAPMYACEQQDRSTAARTAYDNSASYLLHPCAAGHSVQLSAHHQAGGEVDPAAAAAVTTAGVQQQQQPRRGTKKKHRARPPSRRSSTTVVATDEANFRVMVQELTGFPPAAIFRPLPRRVHAVGNPFALAAGHQASSATTTANAAAGSLSSVDAPRAVPAPVMAHQSPQCAPPGVFDGLSDIGSPGFDSWADLSIE